MAQNGAMEIQQQVEESSNTESAKANESISTPPLNFLAIVKDVVPPISTFPVEKLCDQLYSGVFIKPNRLKYWVDKKLNKNCFALYARELQIVWGEAPRYWGWNKEIDEASGEEIEVAELLNVCWLEVVGSFRTIYLSPKTLYEVVFVVKMKNSANHVFPADLTIILPNYEELPTLRRQVRQTSLEKLHREKWIEIQVNEFETSPENVGQVTFSLQNFLGDWKCGLVVKCAIFRPKN